MISRMGAIPADFPIGSFSRPVSLRPSRRRWLPGALGHTSGERNSHRGEALLLRAEMLRPACGKRRAHGHTACGQSSSPDFVPAIRPVLPNSLSRKQIVFSIFLLMLHGVKHSSDLRVFSSYDKLN